MEKEQVYQLHVIANGDKGFTFAGELIDTSGAKDYTFIGTLDFEPAPAQKTVSDDAWSYILLFMAMILVWLVIKSSK